MPRVRSFILFCRSAIISKKGLGQDLNKPAIGLLTCPSKRVYVFLASFRLGKGLWSGASALASCHVLQPDGYSTSSVCRQTWGKGRIVLIGVLETGFGMVGFGNRRQAGPARQPITSLMSRPALKQFSTPDDQSGVERVAG